MIATNCDRLEIYISGQHVTGTPDTADYGSLAYAPVLVDLSAVDPATGPDLRVDGYVGTQLVATLQMSSDPSKDELVLTIDDPVINGDGTDTTRFTFRISTRTATSGPMSGARQVTLTLTGPATLIADNPFPFGTYGGIGGGFIRSQPGRVRPVATDSRPSDPGSGHRPVHRRARASADRQQPSWHVAPGAAVAPIVPGQRSDSDRLSDRNWTGRDRSVTGARASGAVGRAVAAWPPGKNPRAAAALRLHRPV